MKSLFIFIALLVAIPALQAQTLGVDTITWNSSMALNNNNEIDLDNQFIIYANQKIQWTQINGDETNYYHITDTVGEWNNLSSEGQVEFKVRLGTREGSIFFYRNAQGVRVRIDMLRDDVNLVPFEFIISSFTSN
jgi:hypothetical protein